MLLPYSTTTLRNWHSTTYVTVLRVTGGPTDTYLDFQRMFHALKRLFIYTDQGKDI
jgi:hypothetical protein